jgi:lysozyme
LLQILASFGGAFAPQAIEKGITTGINAILPKSNKATITAQMDAGIPVTAGQAQGSEALQRFEAAQRQKPVTGSPLRLKGEKLADLAQESLQPDNGYTASQAANALRTGGKNAAEDIMGTAGARYEDIFNQFPDDVKIPTQGSSQLLAELKQKYQYNPAALKRLNDPLLKNLTSGNVPARDLKFMRGQIDEFADSVASKDSLRKLSGDISGLSRAVNNDIREAVSGGVPGAEKAYIAADRLYAAARKTTDDILSFVDNPNSTDEQMIAKYLKLGNQATGKSARGADSSLYRTLRRRLPNEALDKLESFRLTQLGINDVGDFDAARAVREWRGLTPQAQKMALKNLSPAKQEAWSKSVDFIKDIKGTLNPSGSGAGASETLGLGDIAMLPANWLISHGLANETVARAINKLPRSIMTKPLNDIARSVIAKTLIGSGVAQDKVKDIIPDESGMTATQRRAKILEEVNKRLEQTAVPETIPDTPLRIDIPNPNAQPLSYNIPQDEGLRRAVYTDTVGKRTVGYGFNMDDSSARKVWKQAQIPVAFDDVLEGRAAISEGHAQQLGQVSQQIAINDAADLFPSLATMSEGRKAALINLSYQLGKTKLAGFKEFRAAINRGDNIDAARKLLRSKLAAQTPDRARQIAKLIISG